MDFAPTDDQQLLVDTARRLLAAECPPELLRAHLDDPAAADPLWARLREFTALGDGPATDRCLFCEQTGSVAAPGPFFATAALGLPLLVAARHPELGAARDAGAALTVAAADRAGLWAPHDNAVKCFVPEADRVDHLVVVDPGPTVRVTGPPPAGALRLVPTVDGTRRLFEVDTATLAGRRVAVDAEAWSAWVDEAHAAVAAETVGTARRCFDMALAYAKERVQFDRPIGSFQAIQHKLADMALDLERATAAVRYAAMAIDADDPDRTRAVHVARAAAGVAARRCLKDAIQIHGGIGYTWEHDLHLYLRRATASEYFLGTTGWHHDRLADLLFA